MKDRKLFETIAEAKQIFAIGFDMEDNDDGTQGAEISSYFKFDGITTTDAMKVIGDVLGEFIHEASKKKDTRYAMLRTLVMHVVESMDEDESKAEPEPKTKPETKPERKSDDASLEKIAETLGSIKSLLEVMKALKED